ncbi:GNAT family N-acetyltransferase [Virgibacillus siamensis]|uniref:GNAT family N-acetyltransferase n=1 Tax=Virgibacillus siamensis TaxID=480071 RepID=UPI00098777F7|nr:GNAT family N-acetyltransferase [Virgibacillus siamensis]
MSYIKTLTNRDYPAIFALSQFAFQYEMTGEALRQKEEEANRHIIWGWMSNDELAAKLHLIPLTCYINGKVFEMGGISAVATWPEYRRQGAVKELLHHALNYMKEHGQTISFLHPFSFAFYRKYGWETAFVEKHYSIPLAKLKRQWDTNGYVRRAEDDIGLLHDVYTAHARRFNGTLVRDVKWWEQRVLKGNNHVAAAYDQDHHPTAYIIYQVKEEVFTVKEMMYKTLDGLKQLLQFIANHDSMAENVKMVVPEYDNLSLLLDEPRFDQKLQPYFMARIVDVHRFLEQFPFQPVESQSLPALNVVDDFLPENTGTYQLTRSGTGITCLKSSNGQNEIQCNVQQLASMLMGYKRPMELHEAGLVSGDPEQVKILERIVPSRQTYFPDFY